MSQYRLYIFGSSFRAGLVFVPRVSKKERKSRAGMKRLMVNQVGRLSVCVLAHYYAGGAK
jgi:hypothetical protein